MNAANALKLINVLLLAMVASGATAADRFAVGPVSAGRGQMVSGMLPVPEGPDAATEIPVTVVHGATVGPVLALIAGTHGYEYPPIIALHRIRQTIDPAALRGTLVLVHIANPPSFFRRTIYYSPVDGKNLNRVYPGDPGGTQTQRIAHAITTHVIEQSDYVVDLHAGDGNEALMPFIYMPRTGDEALDRASHELALAFGLDYVVIDAAPLRDPDDSLYTDQTALTRGIPSITTETGKLGSSDDSWVDMAEAGIRNLVVSLGMMPGIAAEPGGVVWLTDYTVVEAPATGLFRAEVHEGYAVAAGGRLGTIVDVFGDELAIVRAPYAGIVNYVIGTPPISSGEPVAMISRIEAAAP